MYLAVHGGGGLAQGLGGHGGRPLSSGRQLPPQLTVGQRLGGGGGLWEGRLGEGGSGWGDLGCWQGGRGAQAPLTSPCPPSNHTITITINLTLTFAASYASHVDWAEQDPPNFVHGCFCHIIALHFGPQHSL